MYPTSDCKKYAYCNRNKAKEIELYQPIKFELINKNILQR